MFKLLVIFLIIIFIVLFYSKSYVFTKIKRTGTITQKISEIKLKRALKIIKTKAILIFLSKGEKAEHNKQQMIKDFLKFAKTGKVDFHSWFYYTNNY